jgi:hypothetical protein
MHTQYTTEGIMTHEAGNVSPDSFTEADDKAAVRPVNCDHRHFVGDAPDPGNLADRVDAVMQIRVAVYHVGLDGRPHLTVEGVERPEADVMPPVVWTGGRR